MRWLFHAWCKTRSQADTQKSGVLLDERAHRVGLDRLDSEGASLDVVDCA